jgi:hypothetical protein
VVKQARVLASVPLLAVGVLFVLYGAFAVVYNGDGGSTTVTLVGRRLDAHLVGGISLAIGLFAIAVGVAIARRRDLGS